MSRRAAIAIDGRPLVGEPMGVGRYLLNLIRRLPALAPDIAWRVVLPARGAAGAPAEGELPAAGLETARLATPLLDNVLTWTHARLPLHLLRRRADLLHGAWYMLPRLCPCPGVVTIHDVTFALHPEWFTRRARILFNGFVGSSARRARHVLTVSERSRRDIIEVYGLPPSRVTAVPLAADPAFAPIADPETLAGIRRRLGTGDEYLLHVGAITPRRNVGRLLDAFAAVRRRAPHLTLVLAGRALPPSLPVEVEVRRKGLQDWVRCPGYVPAEDLPALYAGAAALVYPSLYEGFGLPLLEAMASGVPVLASDGSALSEVAGGAALLVDPTSREAIEEGIWSILSDVALRKELVARGLARAAQFTWDRTARETLGVYRRALEVGAP